MAAMWVRLPSHIGLHKCGASGCVTVTISGKNNQWYGVASDGTRWYSSSATLSRGCNAIRLYSSGGSSSSCSNSSSHSYSSSTKGSGSGSNYYQNEMSSTIENFGNAYRDIMSQGCFSYEGFPYFAVNVGYSWYSDGFVGHKFRTGGLLWRFVFWRFRVYQGRERSSVECGIRSLHQRLCLGLTIR